MTNRIQRLYPLIHVIAGLIMASFGSHARGASPTLEKFHDKDRAFSISLPKGWERQKDAMGAVIIAISPAENSKDPFRENINVVVENLNTKMDTKEYYKSSLTVLKKLFTDFKIEKQGQTKIDKREFYWTTFTHRMNAIKAKVLQYMVVEGKRAYVITASASPEKFNKFKDTFEAAAKTFKLEGKPEVSSKK